jgi:hypothetical protein
VDEKKLLNESRVFGWLFVFFLALGWLGFYLALIGRFSRWPFVLLLLASLTTAIGTIIEKKLKLKISNNFGFIFIFISALVIAYSFFVTPTIFSGRDQGSLSEAAIRLVQNGKLPFSTPSSREIFKIHPEPEKKFENCSNEMAQKFSRAANFISPATEFWCQFSASGKALNFPGFYYLADGNLITQFPLVYISWLAIFYSFFGLAGLIIANAILLFIFLFSFYFLLACFLKKMPAFLAILVAATSFPIFWFFKFTLSENIALAVAWFGIWQLVSFLKEKNIFSYYAVWVSFALLAFCRVEGLVILIPVIVVLLASAETKKFILKNKIDRLFLPLALFLVFLFFDFFTNFVFYKEMARIILDFNLKTSDTVKNGFINSMGGIFQIFSLYGIAYPLLLALVSVVYFLKQKNHLKLVPFFVTLPVFFYLFDPKISADQPWLLRRYVFAIIPVCIYLAFIFLDEWLSDKKKIYFYAILIIMLSVDLPLLYIYGPYSENKNLLPEVEILSRKIGDNDLVLVDREASDNGWAMISGPLNFLYGKQAVYFFNSKDLETMDLQNFSSVFLVVPDKNVDFYLSGSLGARMTYVQKYSLPVDHLEYLPKSANHLPLKIEGDVNGKIFKIKL